MEPAVEPNELMDRIRRAADRENDAGIAPPGIGEPLSQALPPFLEMAITADLLDQAKQILPNAHRKNAVSAGVPKWLRPLARNQGGVNGVMLEVIERLVTANRQLAEQMNLFRGWAEEVGRESARNRAWTAAMDKRLPLFSDERVVQTELRLDRLEQTPGAGQNRAQPGVQPSSDTSLTDLLARTERLEAERGRFEAVVGQLRAQLGEQMDYLRTVHGHLDNLGEHVDAGLARSAQQTASLQETLVRLGEQVRGLPEPTDAA